MPPSTFFPTDALSQVADALTDLAEDVPGAPNAPAEPPPAALAAATTNSVSHVAARLSAVISGYPAAASSPSASVDLAVRSDSQADEHRYERGHGSAPACSAHAGSEGREEDQLTPARLAKELALLHAFGVWAEAALSASIRFRIVRPLAREIAESVYLFAMAGAQADGPASTADPSGFPSIPTFLGSACRVDSASPAGDDARPASRAPAACHVWPGRAEARRHVLRSALAARYGTTCAAPTAALIAGPPLILFVREDAGRVSRIAADPPTACKPSPRRTRATASLLEWRQLTAGACVFQVVDVSDVNSVRATVSQALKDAVKTRGLSPTLVVFDADPDTTLCGGAEVLRAVCDSYGARLHVEGPALAMLAVRPDVMSALEYDVKACVACAHSCVLDVGGMFGFANLCVLSYFNSSSRRAEGGDGDGGTDGCSEEECEGGGADELSMARVMALWWLLQRVRMTSARQVINAAAAQSVQLVDQLAAAPHLVEAQTVGAASNVLMSYAGIEADALARTAVNRAILWRLFATPGLALRSGLEMAQHRNRDWILFSPLLALLRHGIGGRPTPPLSGDGLSQGIIAAARRCEIAKAGASGFLATAKQCEHVEIVPVPPHDSAPLYFGAVRIVPLGLAAGNGHWRRDAEMTQQVEKYTCALAAAIDAAAGTAAFEGVLHHDDTDDGSVPFLCIGPLVSVASASHAGSVDSSPVCSVEDFRSSDASASQFSVDGARELARSAADFVGASATLVVNALSAASAGTDDPDPVTDGVLSGSFLDLEVQSAEASVRQALPAVHGDEHQSLADSEASVSVVDGIESNDEGASQEESSQKREQRDAQREQRPLGAGSGSGSIWERLFGVDDDEDSDQVEHDVVAGQGEGADFFRP
jgi:hypothetical protein